MTDTELLLKKIKMHRLRLETVASTLDISLSSLRNKIYNRKSFNTHEIKSLCTLLDVSNNEMMSIFFN